MIFLEFEKPIEDLYAQIDELKQMKQKTGMTMAAKIERLEH